MAAPTVPVVSMRWGRRPLYELWHRARWPKMQRRTGAVDVVHATGGVIPPAGGAALVVTLHDLAFLSTPEFFTSHGASFMTRGFQIARDEAARLIVPSVATRDACIAEGVEGRRIDVVPWGVTPAQVSDSDRARVRTAHNLPDRFVLWVGAAEPRKNVASLVAAMDAASGLPLVLAGPPGWGVDIAELLAQRPGTRHLGLLTPAELPVLLDLAEVFVYPSTEEGFGMPILEAMAQGTPVITSSTTSTAEVGGDAAVLVDPLDIDRIGEAIAAIVTNPDERAARARAGLARASEMTWDRTAELTEQAYERARR